MGTVLLSVEQRACVLRAIHDRQLMLEGEIERWANVLAGEPARRDAQAGIAAHRSEMECLRSAVRVLWLMDA